MVSATATGENDSEGIRRLLREAYRDLEAGEMLLVEIEVANLIGGSRRFRPRPIDKGAARRGI